MEKDENSIFRTLGYKKDDITRLKSLFSDNLLVALRNHLLSFEMSAEDKSHIAMLQPNDVEMLRKMFVPIADRDMKFGMLGTDMFASMDLSNILVDNAKNLLQARKDAKDYLCSRFDLIVSQTDTALNISENDIIAHETRRTVFAQVDNTLAQIKFVAGNSKEETPEEMAERAKRDSAE